MLWKVCLILFLMMMTGCSDYDECQAECREDFMSDITCETNGSITVCKSQELIDCNRKCGSKYLQSVKYTSQYNNLYKCILLYMIMDLQDRLNILDRVIEEGKVDLVKKDIVVTLTELNKILCEVENPPVKKVKKK